jgi:hypothetical protein
MAKLKEIRGEFGVSHIVSRQAEPTTRTFIDLVALTGCRCMGRGKTVRRPTCSPGPGW